ncbi:MAG: hypothetical protein ACYTG1_11565 [Planctomycetota bacterium]|jgi:hypothetical protein
MERANQWMAIAGGATLILLVWWMSGWTGPVAPPARLDVAWVLITQLPWAALWMTAAFGLGWPVRRWLLTRASDPAPLQLAAGVAVLLVLDAALGRAGVLQAAGGAAAWGLLVVGAALVPAQAGLEWRDRDRPLLVAAASAPGWLWTTEFGGYDALSYHLQLPREWLDTGGIGLLEHNVYSAMPGYMEGAYHHLMAVLGRPVTAAYACQLLHALLAVGAAWIVYRLGTRIGGPLAGAAAGVVLLGTPWVVVTGSLAYTEMPVVLLLAGGLLAVTDRAMPATARALLAGLLVGAACGAKLTAAGLVVVPVTAALLAWLPPRRWAVAVVLAGATCLLVLSPWLVGNSLACGNPVFPFAAEHLGHGAWTPEQSATWRSAHGTRADLGARAHALVTQFLRYGIGPNPLPGEPWRPQWLVLGWLAPAGLAVGLLSPRLRRWSVVLAAVLVLQLLFWMLFTHLKSRFLLPVVVPGSLAVAVGVAFTRGAWPGRSAIVGPVGQAVLAVLLLAWASAPVVLFRREPGGQAAPAAFVGRADLRTGDVLDGPGRLEVAEGGSVAVHLNHLLPRDSRVLLVGDAAPFYYDADLAYQTTWDRGPLSRAMRAAPDDEQAWLARLADEGFTHLLVDAPMLRRWEASGWNDPLITAERVTRAAVRHARVEARLRKGVTLYALE